MNKIQLIQESPYIPSTEIKILEEGYDESGNSKITVRAVLQTSGVKNVNGRIYSPEILASVVEQLSPKAQGRNLLAELDHPMTPSADPSVLKRRAAIVSLENACALITSLEFDGQQIIGVLEILSTPSGKVVQQLLHDKVNIGFSLRALGTTQNAEDGTLIVQSLRAITFDVVANPSHTEARVIEVFNESTEMSDLIKDFELINEEAVVNDNMEVVLEAAAELASEVITENEGSEKHSCTAGVCVRGDVENLIEYIVETALAEPKLNKLVLKV
jgi:hypothetical protein